MKYEKAVSRELFLGETEIENIFISELLPSAPGDFLKIFLYGKMYADAGRNLSDEILCKELDVSPSRLTEAWAFWEDRGAVKRRYAGQGEDAFTVCFLPLRDAMYADSSGREQEEPETGSVEASSLLGDEALSRLLHHSAEKLGRTLSPNEMQTIISWVEELKMPPEAVESAVDYCIERGKTSIRYMEKVVMAWADRGLKTVDAIRDYMAETDEKFYRYRRVMKALGFSRNPSEEEKRLMDEWFSDLGFHMDRVLEACGKTAGISSPNIKYVNSVLRNWAKDAREEKRDVNERKPVTMAELNRYYDFLRMKAEREAEERRREIYSKIPEIRKIDEEIRHVGAELSRMLVMGEDAGKGRKLSAAMEKLDEDRAYLLVEHDYGMDYTDVHYACSKCNDTGMTDMGERCTCIEQRMVEAEAWIQKGAESIEE